MGRKFGEFGKSWAICQTKIIQTLHMKFYDYLSCGINSAAVHILNRPSTMQVMGPPKLNTREIFTWSRPTIVFSPSISFLTATDIRSCTVNSWIPPRSVAALQQLGWAKYIFINMIAVYCLVYNKAWRSRQIPFPPVKHLTRAHYIIITIFYKCQFAKLSFAKSFEDWIHQTFLLYGMCFNCHHIKLISELNISTMPVGVESVD